MLQRCIVFFKIFILWTVVFALGKPLFLLRYRQLIGTCGFADYCEVVWHGLPLDLAMAGYFTVLPALLLIVGIWLHGSWLTVVFRIYTALLSVVVSVATIANLALYDFWGFPLDTTPLFYLFSSPREAFASVSFWYMATAVLLIALVAFGIYCLTAVKLPSNILSLKQRCSLTLILLLLGGALALPIRGGVTVSVTNTGKAYYSTNQRLNHAAVNPLFNLMESWLHAEDFGNQYRFMDDTQATALFDTMTNTSSDGTEKLLRTRRPDILFVVMESFSNYLMTTLGGKADVAVHLDRLAQEGVLFTRFYANSFRTDRGLVSILSGYPAQPTMSLMKYPAKTAHLPSITRSLVDAGYKASYYYGGDANFTNMRSYLMASGFSSIVEDKDFPLAERISKWGAPDHLVFERLLQDIKAYRGEQPTFRVLQTSSSHEPYEVPYQRLPDKCLNAFAYADEAIGRFVEEYKQLPAWKNTLVILVPDHLGAYPPNISNFIPERYEIPMIWIGGAVDGVRRIDVLGSQQDIAATLLGQLGLSHHSFAFSKDMLSNTVPHFAFFTVPDAFGIVTEENTLIYDNTAGRVVYEKGTATEEHLNKGKAYLQKIYDDISKR